MYRFIKLVTTKKRTSRKDEGIQFVLMILSRKRSHAELCNKMEQVAETRNTTTEMTDERNEPSMETFVRNKL